MYIKESVYKRLSVPVGKDPSSELQSDYSEKHTFTQIVLIPSPTLIRNGISITTNMLHFKLIC